MHAHPRRLFSVKALLCDLEIYRSAIRQQFNSESLITFFYWLLSLFAEQKRVDKSSLCA